MGSADMEKEKEKVFYGVFFSGVAFIFLVFIAKFLPILMLTVPCGILIGIGFRTGSGGRKAFNGTLNTVLVFIGLFFVIGMPFPDANPPYYGFLPFWPVHNLVEWFVGLHDSLVGYFKTTFFQKQLIGEVSLAQVSKVLWGSFPLAFAMGAAMGLFGEGKKGDTFWGQLGLRFFRSTLLLIQAPIKFVLNLEYLNLPISVVGMFASVIVMAIVGPIGEKMANPILPPWGLALLVFPLVVLPFFCFMLFTFISFLPVFIPGGRYVTKAIYYMLSPIYRVLAVDIPEIGGRRIAKDTDVSLGRDIYSKKEVILTEKNLNYHTQVIGGSGAGKTNLIKNIITDKIFMNSGLIFLDLKADFETINWIAKAANAAGRNEQLRILSLSEPEISANYNPMKRGSVSELHSKIMNSMKWSEEYYRKASSQALHKALTLLCERRDRYDLEFDLVDLYEVVSFSGRAERTLNAHQFSSETTEVAREHIEYLRTKDGFKTIQGLSTDLYNLTRSAAGPMLRLNPEMPEIDLFDSIRRGEIVYFLMDSMSDKESSEMLGRILLQDIIQTTGQIYNQVAENDRIPTQVIIDEFASFATPNFIDFINRARGAGIGVMVAHQSRGDLREVSENFCDRLERNCATKLIFGTDNDEDAEYFASMVGTQTTVKDTMQMEQGFFMKEETGLISRREVEEFIIHPNVIKNLGQGQLLRVSRLVDIGFNLTKVFVAPEFKDVEPIVSVFDRKRPVLPAPKPQLQDENTREQVPNQPIDNEIFI